MPHRLRSALTPHLMKASFAMQRSIADSCIYPGYRQYRTCALGLWQQCQVKQSRGGFLSCRVYAREEARMCERVHICFCECARVKVCTCMHTNARACASVHGRHNGPRAYACGTCLHMQMYLHSAEYICRTIDQAECVKVAGIGIVYYLFYCLLFYAALNGSGGIWRWV